MSSKPSSSHGIATVSLAILSALVISGCAPPIVSQAPQRHPTAQHPARVPPHTPQSPPRGTQRRRPNPPALTRLPNGHYRVARPWAVALNGRVWRVPAGYQSNGITGPSKVKKSLGDGVRYPETWSAVFHDWLFTQPGISRATADSMFFDLLIAYGVPDTKARLMYSTVSAYSLSKTFR